MRLLLLFVGVPLVELLLIFEVSARMGWPGTLWLVLLTGIAGASLARHQGVGVLARLQTEMQTGRLPAGTVVEGVLVLLAGLALLTPGFLTDALGLACLFPPTRRWFLGLAQRSLQRAAREGRVSVHVAGFGARPGPGAGPLGRTPFGQAPIKDATVIDPGDPPAEGEAPRGAHANDGSPE